jgi:chromosome segregation ATPase
MLLSSLFPVGLLISLTGFVVGSLLIFAGFEENVRKLSSSELSKFSHFYDFKTSIVGKVVSKRLLEKEGVVERLTVESRKLKLHLNKAQASNLDLEQRIAELADSLKKCQEEKNLAEDALHNSQKDLEKLNKTREDELKMIENICKAADKSTKTIDELRSANSELPTKNTELAKTLSTKEQTF